MQIKTTRKYCFTQIRMAIPKMFHHILYPLNIQNIDLNHFIFSVQSLSHVWFFAPHGLQHARLPCPPPTPGTCSNSCPSSWWCYPTISSSGVPFPSCLQSFQHQGLFQWVSSSHQVAKVLELHFQHQSLQWIFRTDFL